MEKDVVARASDASFRVHHRIVLAPFSVELIAGEFWLISGPNGSGKSLAARLLAGLVRPHRGTVVWPSLPEPEEEIEMVSFERVEQLLTEERKRDMSSIMHGATDPGRRVQTFLSEGASPEQLELLEHSVARLGLTHVLDRGLRMLSTGELRKTLLARALSRRPRLLVIDDPYDGLDAASQAELSRVIEEAREPKRTIVVVANRVRDRGAPATHEIEIEAGVVRYAGTRRSSRSLGSVPTTSAEPATREEALIAPEPQTRGSREKESSEGPMLIGMRGVSVSYAGTPILHSVDWDVATGEHWMLYGPNGSGKSTLLSLITGDNPKAYGQQIELFGKRKGSGESVAQIKRHIGFVSGDLQLAFPLRTSVMDTVLSGFYDTMGLFEEPSGLQIRATLGWLRRLGLAEQAEHKLRDLSFGQRRLLLVARAVVKQQIGRAHV